MEEMLLWSVLAVHSLRRMNLNLIRFSLFFILFLGCCRALRLLLSPPLPPPPLPPPAPLPPLPCNNGHAAWSCTLWAHSVDDIDDIDDPSLALNWNSLFDLLNCCYLFMLLSVPRALQFLPFADDLSGIRKESPQEFQSKSRIYFRRCLASNKESPRIYITPSDSPAQTKQFLNDPSNTPHCTRQSLKKSKKFF